MTAALICQFFEMHKDLFRRFTHFPLISLWSMHGSTCGYCNTGKAEWISTEHPIFGTIKANSPEVLIEALDRLEADPDQEIDQVAQKMLDAEGECYSAPFTDLIMEYRQINPVFNLLVHMHLDNCPACDARSSDDEKLDLLLGEVKGITGPDEIHFIDMTDWFANIVEGLTRTTYVRRPSETDDIEEMEEFQKHRFHPNPGRCLISDSLRDEDLRWLLKFTYLGGDYWVHARNCAILRSRCKAAEEALLAQLGEEMRTFYQRTMQTFWESLLKFNEVKGVEAPQTTFF